MNINTKQEEISQMILSYLQKHPGAGDTLEGITRWWLESERVDLSVEVVAEALEALLEKGSLKRVKCDGIFLYKLSK